MENKLLNLEKEISTLMSKKMFRKALEEIKLNEKHLNYGLECWKIREMQLKCFFKIVKHKLNKYERFRPERLDKWMRCIESFIEKISLSLSILEFKEFDAIIRYRLEFYNLNILIARRENHFGDIVGFLALSESLIDLWASYLYIPDTLAVAQESLLFLTSIYIADNDINTAYKTVDKALELIFKELFLRTDSNFTLSIGSTKVEMHKLKKVYSSLVICLFLKGNIEEHVGKIEIAEEFYRIGHWFSQKFLDVCFSDLNNLVEDVNKRVGMFVKLTETMKSVVKEGRRLDEAKNEKEKKDVDHMNPSEFQGIIEILSKFKSIKLKFGDFYLKEDSELVSFLMNEVNLANNLASSNFRKFLKQEKELKFGNFTKEEAEELQLKINTARAQKRYEQKKHLKKQSFTSFRSESSAPIDKNSKDVVFHTSPGKRIKSTFSSTDFQQTRNQSARPERRKFKIRPRIEPVEKIPYDKLLFTPSYKRKRGRVDKFFEKEIGFQKQLLRMKRAEKVLVSGNDPLKIRDDVERIKKKAFRIKDSEEKYDHLAVMQENELDKKLNNVVKSLNPKGIGEFRKTKKEFEKVTKKEKKNPRKALNIKKMTENCRMSNFNALVGLEEQIETILYLSGEKKIQKKVEKYPLLKPNSVDHFLHKTDFY